MSNFASIPDFGDDIESMAAALRSMKDTIERLTGQQQGSPQGQAKGAPLFFMQSSAPEDKTRIREGDLWVNSDTRELRYWDGAQWSPVIPASIELETLNLVGDNPLIIFTDDSDGGVTELGTGFGNFDISIDPTNVIADSDFNVNVDGINRINLDDTATYIKDDAGNSRIIIATDVSLRDSSGTARVVVSDNSHISFRNSAGTTIFYLDNTNNALHMDNRNIVGVNLVMFNNPGPNNDYIQWVTTEGLRGYENGSNVFRIGGGDFLVSFLTSGTTANSSNMWASSGSGAIRRSTSTGRFKTAYQRLRSAKVKAEETAKSFNLIETIKSLNPLSYESMHEVDKDAEGNQQRLTGFVTEEVAEAYPEALCDDGENYDTRAILALTVAGLQEALEKIEALETGTSTPVTPQGNQ